MLEEERMFIEAFEFLYLMSYKMSLIQNAAFCS